VVGGADVRYTLTNSGHIAGIVNPPGNPKSEHWTKAAVRSEDAETWRSTAEHRAGSWWEDWAVWASAHAGELVAPAELPPGEPAPGHYVRNETAPPIKRPKKKKKKKR
jgi:polyhydroxyalkanoate synthase